MSGIPPRNPVDLKLCQAAATPKALVSGLVSLFTVTVNGFTIIDIVDASAGISFMPSTLTDDNPILIVKEQCSKYSKQAAKEQIENQQTPK
ncbi:MAG TPA: hypothetical protein VEM40_03675 [Nitrospirota bacterium]|nr:hypothetical protein [Nitrospirota bacterium]